MEAKDRGHAEGKAEGAVVKKAKGLGQRASFSPISNAGKGGLANIDGSKFRADGGEPEKPNDEEQKLADACSKLRRERKVLVMMSP